jgi:glucose-1-phosphate adenylyltransferase
VIGIRTRVGRDARISGSVVLGADYYQREEEREKDLKSGVPPVGIGAGSVVSGAILDKNVRIGKNVVIENSARVQEAEHPEKGYWIRGGIVIVTKDAVIPDGTTI